VYKSMNKRITREYTRKHGYFLPVSTRLVFDVENSRARTGQNKANFSRVWPSSRCFVYFLHPSVRADREQGKSDVLRLPSNGSGRKGGFRRGRNKKDKEERNLYDWLNQYALGGRYWDQARWEKLNEAFGEGWEKECFPNLETGGGFQPGHQYVGPGRDEAQWDAILEAVKEFKRIHGRFPRSTGDHTKS
jgi:hypothetical protein